MVIWGVLLYLVATAAVIALVCMHGLRERVIAWSAHAAARVAGAAGRRVQGRFGALWRIASRWGAGSGDALAWLGLRPSWRMGAALGVLLILPAGALWLRQHYAYDGFDHTVSRWSNAQITALLQGEQLVPPPRLPPEVFTTREVEQAHPLAASASRQWELLDADFRQRLLLAYKLMREQHGYEMVLIEGWRSPQRQAQLQAMGPHVTHAGAGQSYHQYGLAADSAFWRDGRIVISERDAWAAEGYRHFGAIAQSLGLVWGGSWRSLQDLGHVELQRAGVLSRAP